MNPTRLLWAEARKLPRRIHAFVLIELFSPHRDGNTPAPRSIRIVDEIPTSPWEVNMAQHAPIGEVNGGGTQK